MLKWTPAADGGPIPWKLQARERYGRLQNAPSTHRLCDSSTDEDGSFRERPPSAYDQSTQEKLRVFSTALSHHVAHKCDFRQILIE